MPICHKCKVAVSKIAKHINRKRCMAQHKRLKDKAERGKRHYSHPEINTP